MRRAGGLDGLQADEAADAVIDMHDEIAGRRGSSTSAMKLSARFDARRGRTSRSPRMSCSPMTAMSAVSKPPSRPSTASATCGFGSASASGHDADRRQIVQPVLGQHVAHALARALAPQRDDDALARRLQRLDVLAHRIEHVGGIVRALGREIVPGARADIDHRAALLRHRERRQPRQRRGLQPLGPFGFRQIEPVRRQRLVGRAACARRAPPCAPRSSRRSARAARARRPRPAARATTGAPGTIVEQRVELVVEQRQPVLHAGMAAAFADRLVEQVARVGRAERRHIAGAEAPDRVGRELEFGDRHEIERAHLHHGALRLRIEAADRLQRVAEEIEPHRLVHAGGEQVEDAAAHRVVAGLAHRRGAVEAVELEPADDAVHAEHVAGRGRQRLLADQVARRHALQRGVDGGEQHRGLLAALDAGEPRQRGHALRHDAAHAATRGRRAGSPRPGIAAPRCRARRTPARAPAPPCAARRGRSPARWSPARLARAATARARSAMTRPSAPSATLASVSGRPGASSSAGDLVGIFAIGHGPA